MLTRIGLTCLGVAALAARAEASPAPSCSNDGLAKKHGDYIAGIGPCTINADNYYTYYLDDNYPATSTSTRYTNILADFAGASTTGNLKKLTANRVGACPNAGGTCGSSFWEGDDPTVFPDNEKDSWASVALYNPAKDNGKLLVFFAGSPVRPKTYIDFGLRAAHAGYHVILLSYVVYGATSCMNDGASASWSWAKGAFDASQPDSSPSVDECISEIIGYVADGKSIRDPYWADFNARTPGTTSADSAHNRTKLLLYWLQQSFPDQGWDKFFQRPCAGNLCGHYDVSWGITAVAAHSMGTQLATYFETKFALDRVIMLAGPHPHLETGSSLHASDASAVPINMCDELVNTLV